MGTKMLRGPSLKSLSLLRTVCLLQIMILTISGGGVKGCYLDNFSSKSGKIMICDRGGGVMSLRPSSARTLRKDAGT